MKDNIKLPEKSWKQFVEKLDNKNEQTITWSEFIGALEREGQARELLNDLRICASGLTRIKPGHRYRINKDDHLTAYAID